MEEKRVEEQRRRGGWRRWRDAPGGRERKSTWAEGLEGGKRRGKESPGSHQGELHR